MNEKNGLDMLNQEIEIPEVVNRKAREAFTQIRREAGDGRETAGRLRAVSRRKRTKKSAAVMILVAAMALGTLTVAIAASHSRLSAGIRAYLGITDEQEQALIEDNDPILDLVEERNANQQAEDSGEGQTADHQPASDGTFAGQDTEEEKTETEMEMISATDQGITITVEQTMADNFVIMVAFRIEGVEYDPEKESAPHFFPRLTLDGRNAHASSGAHTIIREDGSIEYDVTFRPSINHGEDSFAPGEFIGKEIQISVDKIYVSQSGKDSEGYRTVEGSWDLSWTLGGTETLRIENPNEPLGNTGAVVKEIQISPLSLTVIYDFPYEELTGTAYDGEGNTREVHYTTDPPLPWGIIMADGTEYSGRTTSILGGGGKIYRSWDNRDETYVMNALNALIDPEQVAGILFHDPTGVTGEGEIGTIFTVMFEE